ncbi:uncharacterized protein LOC124366457 [Homalodisca vitripennis]|uniref:uncharacterized protein LOC124366457 n=1 Tax=Homalodisca vitripennis TaxID=197043 RepID=UPI001EEB757B|nr:uncharacterized protein LOC124366457 [Homalodisca vitripennis]XP_046678985.1 uncharacterized protein LOC124366457 [Homalodisca vitripennis]KAG8291822.1 hypothetical protein J6590_051724 [Homalodisca vitripennis]
MAKNYLECRLLIRNLTNNPECQKFNGLCCYGSCCIVARHQRELWENWYFWFIVALVAFLVITSFVSYVAGSCKRKRHHLIRIRNTSSSAASASLSHSGLELDPGGIIQPHLAYNKKSTTRATAIIANPGDLMVEDFTGPLSPPYPPVQQVTIVRGSAPPLGFRQTNHYTELVLPPGFVDTQYAKR